MATMVHIDHPHGPDYGLKQFNTIGNIILIKYIESDYSILVLAIGLVLSYSFIKSTEVSLMLDCIYIAIRLALFAVIIISLKAIVLQLVSVAVSIKSSITLSGSNVIIGFGTNKKSGFGSDIFTQPPLNTNTIASNQKFLEFSLFVVLVFQFVFCIVDLQGICCNVCDLFVKQQFIKKKHNWNHLVSTVVVLH